mmetsp:Transcript_6642/g.16930  ORF Transcript_6642/g.16930 Transcript_6642/m.16930 type:complete len:211 (-) Transcript_6642:181-813(-)
MPGVRHLGCRVRFYSRGIRASCRQGGEAEPCGHRRAGPIRCRGALPHSVWSAGEPAAGAAGAWRDRGVCGAGERQAGAVAAAGPSVAHCELPCKATSRRHASPLHGSPRCQGVHRTRTKNGPNPHRRAQDWRAQQTGGISAPQGLQWRAVGAGASLNRAVSSNLYHARHGAVCRSKASPAGSFPLDGDSRSTYCERWCGIQASPNIALPR